MSSGLSSSDLASALSRSVYWSGARFGEADEPSTAASTRRDHHDDRSAGLLEGLHILVVDDEVDARELFAMVLRSTGARVTVAGGVDEALAAFVAGRPDVLISDIGMPGEDGYSLIRRVRSLSADAGGSIPAVALTAFTSREHRERALASGFTMHVPKPVDPDRLIAVAIELAALARGR
jgi:CheY-like chemotaxis protein